MSVGLAGQKAIGVSSENRVRRFVCRRENFGGIELGVTRRAPDWVLEFDDEKGDGLRREWGGGKKELWVRSGCFEELGEVVLIGTGRAQSFFAIACLLTFGVETCVAVRQPPASETVRSFLEAASTVGS